MMVVLVEAFPMFSVTFSLLRSSMEGWTGNSARMLVGMVRRNRESFEGFAESCEVPASLGLNEESQAFSVASILV
jgi:hypothetical protein